jgi:hypothetical protein
MANAVDRVASAAQAVKPLRVLLSVLAAPFYVLGLLVGFAVVAATWCYAAVQVGVQDARRSPKSEPES